MPLGAANEGSDELERKLSPFMYLSVLLNFFLFNYKHVIKRIQAKQRAWLYLNRTRLGMGDTNFCCLKMIYHLPDVKLTCV